MQLLYRGKTKEVYALDDGNILLKFKDEMTGEDGVFDPGANQIGLVVEGAGKAGLKLTKFFFEKCKEAQIPTHYIDCDIENNSMTVKRATVFGKGLEVICRFRAVGSFYRRYGAYIEEGQALDSPFVEMTLKDDQRNDPPISADALALLNIMTQEEYDTLKELTLKIAGLVKKELAKKDLELYDIKFEFGRDENGQIILIDEISGGNMRVYKDGKMVEPLQLAKMMLDE